MPELPEVESLRRDLSRSLIGRRIEDVELRLPKIFLPSAGMELATLRGKRIDALRRRAKLLLWQLSDDLTLALHLRLAGQVVHRDSDGGELAHGGHPVPAWGAELPHRATHATFLLDDASRLYLTDIRQFGRLWLMPEREVSAFVERLRFGPEPLTEDFTVADFAARLARRSLPIKTVLLDQGVIGGVGNIYADEALWAAGIHPKRPARSLTTMEVQALHAAVRSVLQYAVDEGVAFVPRGRAVSDRAFPYAHGRSGTACPRCGSTFTKEWIGGRGSTWCPSCQK